MTKKDYLVTVCDSCLTASCWHGIFLCNSSHEAGTIDLPASKLLEMGKESSHNFSREKLTEICGGFKEIESCDHVHLNMEGICHGCGKDCRGIG